MSTEPTAIGPAGLERFLREWGFLAPGQGPPFTALAGGVSSDIWRVALPDDAARSASSARCRSSR